MKRYTIKKNSFSYPYWWKVIVSDQLLGKAIEKAIIAAGLDYVLNCIFVGIYKELYVMIRLSPLMQIEPLNELERIIQVTASRTRPLSSLKKLTTFLPSERYRWLTKALPLRRRLTGKWRIV